MTRSYIDPPYPQRYKPRVFYRNMQSVVTNQQPPNLRPHFHTTSYNEGPTTHCRMVPRKRYFIRYENIPPYAPHQNANMRGNINNRLQLNAHVQSKQNFQPTHYLNPPTYIVNNHRIPINPPHNPNIPFIRSYARAAMPERVVYPNPNRKIHTLPLQNRFQAFTENSSHVAPTLFRGPTKSAHTFNKKQMPLKTQKYGYVWPDSIFPAAKTSRQYFDTRMSLHQLEKDLDKQTDCLSNLKTKLTQTLLGQALFHDTSDSTLSFRNHITANVDEIIHEVSFFRKDFYLTKLKNLKTEFIKLHDRLTPDEKTLFRTDFVQWGLKFIKGRRLFNSARKLYPNWFNDLLKFDLEEIPDPCIIHTNPDRNPIDSASVSSLDMFDNTASEIQVTVQDKSSTSSSAMSDELDSDISITELNEIRAALKRTPITKRRKIVRHSKKRSTKKSKSSNSTPKQTALTPQDVQKSVSFVPQTNIVRQTDTAVYNIEQAIHQPSMFNMGDRIIPNIERKIERATQRYSLGKYSATNFHSLCTDIHNHTVHIEGPKLISIQVGGNDKLDSYPTDYLIHVERPSATFTKTFAEHLIRDISNINKDIILELVSISTLSETIPWLNIITAIRRCKIMAVLTTSDQNRDAFAYKLKTIHCNDADTSATLNNENFLTAVHFFQEAHIPQSGI
jgi:hypothetical protein